jgi:hypothetical protein
MTTVGISLIAMGAALVFVGLTSRLRAPPTDSAANLDHDEFRTILDALDEVDRRDQGAGPAVGHEPN